jgi:hypothetical protein
MRKRIYRSYKEPKREGLSWDERWIDDDKGLITCWEIGREKREKEPELAARAENGELPVLGWKGGVEKNTINGEKYGTLYYLAQWQGLRGEDLDIDPSKELEITCSKTGMKITYTGDVRKYSDA